MAFFSSFRRSILTQLLWIISGASIISALVSTVGHYFYTERLIQNSINQQMSSALELTTTYLEENYSEELRYDLNLLNSSTEINSLLGSKRDEYFIRQQNVEKLFLSFSINRSDLYHSIRLLDIKGNELAIIRDKRRIRDFESVITSTPTPRNLMVAELFQQLKNSRAGTIIFSRPAFENDEVYFYAGIAKSDPDIGGFGGAVIITFTLDKFKNYLNNFKVFDHSLVWVFTHTGDTIYAVNDKDAINPYPFIHEKAPKPENLTVYTSEKLGEDSLQHIIQIAIALQPDARRELLKNLIVVTGILLVTITFIGIIIAILTARSIVYPIRNITRLSQHVAAGDLDIRIPQTTDDEIGTLGQAFNIMVEELKEQQFELELLANKDTLTQLPNRRQFEESLIKTIKYCARAHQSIALLYIDLDQFKYTNDTFGHPAGDKLIRDVAKRLTMTVRETDLVARLGGDEFAIIIDPHKTREDTEAVAKKILERLSKPFLIEGHQIFSGGSIGISIYPEHGKDSTEIVKNADTAMYRAKQLGRNNYQFYSAELSNESNEKVILGSLIRKAIDNNSLEIYYQPKVDLRTHKINGAEALLRWNHSDNKKISPSKIVDIAESAGFANRVDHWVANQVFKQISEWQQQGIKLPSVSINFSGKMLEKAQLVDILKDAFKKYPINPTLIEIEITENNLISNYREAHKALVILHEMGIKLAIDDFGTGYSSLSYLKNIAADILKIDRKFVIDTMKNEADRAIATAMVQLATSLDMQIVVEGIETKEQASFFMTLGAHSAQGFYYYKPLDSTEFINQLKFNQIATDSKTHYYQADHHTKQS